MNKADLSLQLLKYWLRDEFTTKLKTTCDLKSRQCRGGSKDLYKLLIQSPSAYQYLKTDKEHLQIVSGLGHTFIRFKDDTHDRFIYIDPTIAQFVPTFDGIFIGTAADLESLTKEPRSTLDITDYIEDPRWTGKTHPPLTIEYGLMAGGRRSRRHTLRKQRKTKTKRR
jgi:hypothetical protein